VRNQGITPNPVAKVNTDDRHEASATYSKDGKLMVFARSNDGSRKGPTDVDLYQSKLGPDGNWSDPELLSVSSLTAWDASPALSPDGKTLYFSSNREGGKGGNDLYRSTLDANGRWGKPTNLGETINTAGDEMFPYVTEDGKLYFASDGQAGFGGLDLFVATRNKEEGTKVENLGMPINSKADDFGIVYKNAYEGYLSSNREGGKGDDDIYYFKNLIAEPKIVRYNVKGTISGKNNGADEGALGGAHVKITDAAGQPVADATTDPQGNFNFMAEEDKTFNFMIEHEGYFAKRDNFSTSGKRPPLRELKNKENTVDLTYGNALDKIKLEQTIVIENIYYDYDKSDIRPDAATELDKVVTMLTDNPAISIELSSHTDSRGDDSYNKDLSQARAESAVAYIVSKGVDKNRIYAKGYGETKPIIANASTDDEFQKNRRTEFKVTKIARARDADDVTAGSVKKKPAKAAPAKKGAAKKPAPKK
jgi:outer membrane protein OmpA-like peptidoglycan-associated protein